MLNNSSSLSQPEIFVTSTALVEKAFPGWREVCSGTFLLASKDSYTLEWLWREIVQNFVDNNVLAPHTFNGVKVRTTDLNGQEDQGRQIHIEGAWEFMDCSNLLRFGSDKNSSDPNQLFAGGNGLGLKQTILRFMRDYEVTRFAIQGENWLIEYKYLTAEEINQNLADLDVSETVEHGSLIVRAEASFKSGTCAYIIETTHDAVLSCCLEDLAVCDANPALHDLDIDRPHFKLKLLTPTELETDSVYPEAEFHHGRLFINGQIFKFSDHHDGELIDHWGGPRGITLAVNYDYGITVDRAALPKYELNICINSAIRTELCRNDLIQLLNESQANWKYLISSEKKGIYYNDALKLIVSHIGLQFSEIDGIWRSWFTKEDYIEMVGDKKYLAMDMNLSDKQARELQNNGFILCPSWFTTLHMPRVSEELDTLTQAVGDAVDANQSLLNGISPVPHYPDIECVDISYAGYTFKRTMKNMLRYVEILQQPSNTLRFTGLPILFPKDLVKFSKPDTAKRNENLIYSLRGLAYALLSNELVESIYLAEGSYLSIFSIRDGMLYVENKQHLTSDSFIDVRMKTPEDCETFVNAYNAPFWRSSAPKNDSTSRSFLPRILTTKTRRIFLAASCILGGIWFMPSGEDSALYEQLNANTSYDSVNDSSYNGRPSGTLSEIRDKHQSDVGFNAKQLLIQAHNDTLGFFKTLAHLLDTQSIDQSEFIEAGELSIVDNPSDSQVKKLSLLKEFFTLTTGVDITQKMYIFRGYGVLGLNNSRQFIGINEADIDNSFSDALGVLVHEVAHNDDKHREDHGPQFEANLASLFLEMVNTVNIASGKTSGDRTNWEERIIAIPQEWERLNQ